MEAPENAEKNDFKYIYPTYDNSFNAYGILVDKVGVCTSDIAEELIKELDATGAAVLRTDYELDDPTFYAIAQEVMEKSGRSDIYGYYWLGLICLTTETSK